MKPVITDITGIGPAAAVALGEHGIRSLRVLARASVEQVSAVPGFSVARANKVIAAAADLLATPGAETTLSDKPEKKSKDKKRKDKKKKDKKKKDKKGKRKKKDKKKAKK